MAGYPLDTVKVRIQTSPAGTYGGTFSCLAGIAKQEGVAGLYRGMSSPLLGVAGINAITFGVNAQVRYCIISVYRFQFYLPGVKAPLESRQPFLHYISGGDGWAGPGEDRIPQTGRGWSLSAQHPGIPHLYLNKVYDCSFVPMSNPRRRCYCAFFPWLYLRSRGDESFKDVFAC